VRDGATANNNTQVCMPSVPMFANPHGAHEAIVDPRVDREFCDVIGFDARGFSERGTPAKCKRVASIIDRCEEKM